MSDDALSEAGALFCTHKRGAGLVLFRMKSAGLTETLRDAVTRLQKFSRVTPESSQIAKTGASVSLFRTQESSFFSAISAGMTAENLAELYRLGLTELNLKDSHVSVIGVVSGPGSFTGLRLGCSFVNGLILGRPRELWTVNGVHPDEVGRICQISSQDGDRFFWGEHSTDQDDPYAVPTAFADLLAHLKSWAEGCAQKVEVAEPHYGREPTPVLKLKLQQGEFTS